MARLTCAAALPRLALFSKYLRASWIVRPAARTNPESDISREELRFVAWFGSGKAAGADNWHECPNSFVPVVVPIAGQFALVPVSFSGCSWARLTGSRHIPASKPEIARVPRLKQEKAVTLMVFLPRPGSPTKTGPNARKSEPGTPLPQCKIPRFLVQIRSLRNGLKENNLQINLA